MCFWIGIDEIERNVFYMYAYRTDIMFFFPLFLIFFEKKRRTNKILSVLKLQNLKIIDNNKQQFKFILDTNYYWAYRKKYQIVQLFHRNTCA